MKQISLTPEALSDLSGIRKYTIDRWGTDQGERYLGEMGQLFRDLSAGLKVSHPVGRGAFRKIRHQSHMIYFVEDDHGINIVRVLHVRMDAVRHLP